MTPSVKSVRAGPASPRELFFTFSRVGLSGFGGVNFWMRRIVVQEKGWITDQEYLEAFALGQLIPGPNVFNVAVMMGHRFGGVQGALLAVAGLIGAPLCVVLALGVLYKNFGALPVVQHALGGMAAVAAGLILANSVNLASALPRHIRPWIFLALAFAGMGILRWPFFWVMFTLGPLAIVLQWYGKEG